MALPAKIPDIIRFPLDYAKEAEAWDRLNHISNIAEPILQVDKDKGERCRCWTMERPEKYAGAYAIKDKVAQLRYPVGHPKYPQDRYEWHDAEDGIKYGYLKE